MKYWKKIKWDDKINPGDILMCTGSVYSQVVVVKECSEMTGVTCVRWINGGCEGAIQEKYWAFDWLVKFFKKLIIV